MKLILTLCLGLVIASCSSNNTKKPTAAEQVAGLQKMCKDSADTIKARQAKTSLYKRLGEKEKIGVFATNLIAAHKANKDIGHRFKNSNDKRLIENTTQFLIMGSGGKANYKGGDIKKVHQHMNVTNADFLSAGGDVQVL
jgi:hemoglobin